MVNVLVIGDFHGKFSVKLKKKIEKEKFDVVLSQGDFCGNEKLAKLFFKHVYGKKDDEIPEKVKKEINRLDKISIKDGIKVIKELKKLKKPVYCIKGNWDVLCYADIGLKKDYKLSEIKKFDKNFNENLKLIEFKLRQFDDFVLIGGTSSTYPGKVDKNSIKASIKRKKLDKKEATRKIKEMKKEFNRRNKKYNELFKKAEKSGKQVIFLTHNCPYLTKLDKIKKGPQKGKHFGSWLEKQIIKKHKPLLVLCGHMHEYQGKQKLGKTLIVNPGAAVDGKAVIIEIDKKKVKKVRFLR